MQQYVGPLKYSLGTKGSLCRLVRAEEIAPIKHMQSGGKGKGGGGLLVHIQKISSQNRVKSSRSFVQHTRADPER